MSSDDEDVMAVRRNRQRPLFNHDDVSSSPPHAPAKRAPRARPHFLGDGDDDPVAPAPDDLFSDLDDVPNEALPARLNVDAFERLKNTAVGARDFDAPGDDDVFGGQDGDGVDGVKEKKKRIIARMDDERLLGPTGFPRLLENAKTFKPKGKGHEVKDLKRLMTVYQLWAHQMFPRTNLRDTLTTVERLCHKRRVHHALKGYRDEAKVQARKLSHPDSDNDDDPTPAPAPGPSSSSGPPPAKKAGPSFSDDDFGDLDADEEAALAEPERAPPAPAPKRVNEEEQEQEEDYRDEEDAFREAERELEMMASKAPARRPQAPPPDDGDVFDEDEAAMMAELEEAASSVPKKRPPPKVATPAAEEEDEFGFADDEDAMLAELDLAAAVPKASASAKRAPVVIAIDDEDEFGDMGDDEALTAMDLTAVSVPPTSSAPREQEEEEEDDFADEEAMLVELERRLPPPRFPASRPPSQRRAAVGGEAMEVDPTPVASS